MKEIEKRWDSLIGRPPQAAAAALRAAPRRAPPFRCRPGTRDRPRPRRAARPVRDAGARPHRRVRACRRAPPPGGRRRQAWRRRAPRERRPSTAGSHCSSRRSGSGCRRARRAGGGDRDPASLRGADSASAAARRSQPAANAAPRTASPFMTQCRPGSGRRKPSFAPATIASTVLPCGPSAQSTSRIVASRIGAEADHPGRPPRASPLRPGDDIAGCRG